MAQLCVLPLLLTPLVQYVGQRHTRGPGPSEGGAVRSMTASSWSGPYMVPSPVTIVATKWGGKGHCDR
jgi:hypothetical protein